MSSQWWAPTAAESPRAWLLRLAGELTPPGSDTAKWAADYWAAGPSLQNLVHRIECEDARRRGDVAGPTRPRELSIATPELGRLELNWPWAELWAGAQPVEDFGRKKKPFRPLVRSGKVER